MDNFFITTFESFVVHDLLLEASALSKTGMPNGMISAVHRKAEHWDEYSRMAHTYRSNVAIPMPFKYHVPSHEIEITEPKKLTGVKTNTDPYSGRTIKSQYSDFHWFIESLPFGQNRALIANPDLDFYMYIYHKSKSKGAPGMQYAILWWDKDRKKAVDFGYSELTTRAVDLSQIRKVHDTKGGNRSDKIQEFIRSVTKEGRDYAPSPTKPLYAYTLNVDSSGMTEPRQVRKSRIGKQSPVMSMDFINVFAKKYATLLSKAKDPIRNKIIEQVNSTHRYLRNTSSPEVQNLAQSLGVDSENLNYWLFMKFRDFRQELYKIGVGAYQKTSGFDLEAENKMESLYSSAYRVPKKRFSPDEEKTEPEQEFREAQPEKYKRELPISGEYASIQSIIKSHTLDGALHRFFYYLVTGKLTAPHINILAILGIDPEKEDFTGMPDFETWTL
jgi:hypothetical protein